MRLLEAIIDANHRAVGGDAKAGLRPGDYSDSLPLIALTCIDPRLNALFPNILALRDEQFIWMRNAGNIITGPMSSTMRSLALACAVKKGREIAVIGHTDCRIRQNTVSALIDQFKALGIEREALPENVADFFGVFASERQNVIQSVEHIRSSPLIGPSVPVHGLMVDVKTGRLEWVVNGYEALGRAAIAVPLPSLKMPEIGRALKDLPLGQINPSEHNFPQTRIGEISTGVGQEVRELNQGFDTLKQSVRFTPAPEAVQAPKPEPQPAMQRRQPPSPPLPPVIPTVTVNRQGKWGLRD